MALLVHRDYEFLTCRDSPWVSSSFPFKAHMKDNVLSDIRWVSQQTNRDKHYWKEEIVRDMFEEGYTSLILILPYSFMRCPDKLIWHHSQDGSYNVKSGYHFASVLHHTKPHQDNNGDLNFWWSIWDLNLSNKIKMFLLRALHGSLAVQLNFQWRF